MVKVRISQHWKNRCETAKSNTMVFLHFKMTKSGFPRFFLQHMSSLGQTHSVSVNISEEGENHLRFHGIGYNKALDISAVGTHWGLSTTETKKPGSSK